MNSIPFSLEQKIHQVITQKISLKYFEQWLYQNDELEVLNPNLYLELISFNYSHKSSFKEFQLSFAKYVSFHKFEADLIREYLYSIIERENDYERSIWRLYELYCTGYEFLQKLGLKYGLCLIDTSYPDELANDSNDVIDMFYPDIISDAKNVLGWLEEGKIIFREEKSEGGGFEYDDLRTEQEKQQGKF